MKRLIYFLVLFSTSTLAFEVSSDTDMQILSFEHFTIQTTIANLSSNMDILTNQTITELRLMNDRIDSLESERNSDIFFYMILTLIGCGVIVLIAMQVYLEKAGAIIKNETNRFIGVNKLWQEEEVSK